MRNTVITLIAGILLGVVGSWLYLGGSDGQSVPKAEQTVGTAADLPEQCAWRDTGKATAPRPQESRGSQRGGHTPSRACTEWAPKAPCAT